ncbi:MAG: undecaprenyl-phosphate galactose phosphotransferase WbaP, partial [Spirochaetaceae bacterium]|nr:undecaprenyl-phosphate galactose phosphotransferase WbaP [Spirochaetaceae bacterium]
MYWIYLPAFIIVFYIAKLYPGIMLSPADEIRRLTISSACCFIGIALSIAVETDGKIVIVIAMLLALPISIFALPLGRQISRTIFSKFKFWGVPVVIYIESMENTLVIDRLLNHPDFGYKPALILCKSCKDENMEYHGIPVMTPNNEITEEIKKLEIKTAIIIETSSNLTESDEKLYTQIMNMYRYTIYIPHNKYISSLSATVRDFNGIIGFST